MLEEARFFGISKAIEPLELMVQNEELALSGHFTRKEFLRMLSITSSSASLRCQVSVCRMYIVQCTLYMYMYMCNVIVRVLVHVHVFVFACVVCV